MTGATIDLMERLRDSLNARAITPAPEPGLYANIAMPRYHAWNAVSNSRLSKLRRSPAHLRAYLDEPAEDTASQVIGRAVHSAILEPDDFAKRYVRGPEGDRRTKAVKEAWDSLVVQYGEGHVLKPADYDCALRTRDAVHVHSSARAILAQLQEVELSVVWHDEKTGLTCKARWDGYAPGVAGGVIVDVKSTLDASQRAFERSIYNYGYHRQGGFYLDAAIAHCLPVSHYLNIAVEKDAPNAVAVYRLVDGAIDAGRQQIEPLMQSYAKCLATNEWPAYSQDVVDAHLPDYAWKQIDDEITFGTNYEVEP